MLFEMTHRLFKTKAQFSETEAPDWLTSKNTTRGSTCDSRWFWEDQVLTLKVGESIDTDFQTITRKQ